MTNRDPRKPALIRYLLVVQSYSMWAIALLSLSMLVPISSTLATPDCTDDKHADNPNCTDDGGDPANPPFVATHITAVGHDFDCAFNNIDPSLAECDPFLVLSEVFDRGTDDDPNDDDPQAGHAFLDCAVYGGGWVDCGHTSNYNIEPRPLVDISRLFRLWDDPNNSQGFNPSECFGNGIVQPIVSVGAGADGGADFTFILHFNGQFDNRLVADGGISDQCAGKPPEPVKYEARISQCTADNTFPPDLGGTTEVTCLSGIAPVEVKHGGGRLKKCSCTAQGTLENSVSIYIKHLD